MKMEDLSLPVLVSSAALSLTLFELDFLKCRYEDAVGQTTAQRTRRSTQRQLKHSALDASRGLKVLLLYFSALDPWR
jgi:hypothetical protein